MNHTTMVVLGGCGQVGRSVVRLLLEHTDASIVIAECRLEEAEALARELRSRKSPERLKVTFADASKPDSLRSAFRDADLVIVTSTTPDYTANVARACLDQGCDYFDILDSTDVVEVLEGIATQVKKAHRLFVTQGGLAPGMPAALARWVQPSFDRYMGARLGIALSLKTTERYEKVYDVFEFLVKTRSLAFWEGRWREVPFNKTARLYFGPRFGWRDAFPVDMIEMHDLPAQLGLEEVSIYAASPNRIVDYLARRLIWVLYRIKPRLGWPTLARIMLALSRRMTREPSGFSNVLEAWGQRDGKDVAVRVIMDHEDNYFSTAICVLAFVNQYLTGTFDGIAGVKMMGHIIDPGRAVQDLRSMGITVSQEHIRRTA